MHAALQEVLKNLSMPALPKLQSLSADPPVSHDPGDNSDELEDHTIEEVGPTRDNSPRLPPKEDALLPIESLYEVTRLRSLRTDDPGESPPNPQPHHRGNEAIHDFISRGLVKLGDAELLTHQYLSRLDHYMYGIGGRYKTLEELRRNSEILTVCICTVAALHDSRANHLYTVCHREFRRLMAASLFDRRLDRDHLRSMVIASYWLSDISWIVSGYGIRRATEVNLNANYARVITEHNEDAADCMRLWYILWICDQHLSILYGRPSSLRQDACIQGWEAYVESPIATDDDRRLISQVSLLIIMGNVRELFGPDTGEAIPPAFLTQISNFSRQLDQWLGTWTTSIQSKCTCTH